MERQNLGEHVEYGRRRAVRCSVPPRESHTAHHRRTAVVNLSSDRDGHDHAREVMEEVETPELILMDDRARVAHDLR